MPDRRVNPFRKPSVAPPVVPTMPSVKPIAPEIPPEGFKTPIIYESGETVEATIMPDNTVWVEDKKIATFDPTAGDITPIEPSFWQKAGYYALTALDVALYPFTGTGMGIWSGLEAVKEAREQELWKTRGYKEAKPELVTLQDIMTPYTPQGEKYKEFRELPWWQQLLYESPAWGMISALPIAALAEWRAAAVLPTAQKIAVRTALAPLAGAEVVTGVTLKYGIVIPIKYATKGVSQATLKSFEMALDTGLDRWLATQGRLRPEIRGKFANFIIKDRNWLIEKATNNMLKRQAEARAKKQGLKQAQARAVKDTIKDVEVRLLEAPPKVILPEVKPVVKPPVAKPEVKPPIVEVKPVPEIAKLAARRTELKETLAKPAKELPKGATKIELRQELRGVSAKLVPQEKKLRQKIMAAVKLKALPSSQYRAVFKEIGGSRYLSDIKEPELTRVFEAVKRARPAKIKAKTVITKATEDKIQSLKESLIAEKYITEDSFGRLMERLHLKTARFETPQRFITESEGKQLIRAMNDEAEIGYTKQQTLWQEGLDKNPNVVTAVNDLQKRIAKEGEVYFQGKPADVSILKDMRFFTEDLETRTGEVFYHIYFLMNRKQLDIRMASNKLKRRQIGATPDFRKIINDDKALKRINDYIAAKNKWMDVKSPTDITTEEIKLANALEDILFELQPDFRLHRFTNFYSQYEGNVEKIAGEIPDAPKADIKIAVNIYESQGMGKLKAYLDTRTWGVIESGFEPHYVVNPRLATRRLRTAFPTGRFKSRSGVEFYPADLNVVQRVDRYTQQMLSFDLRPFVRELERLYREAIPKLKNPSKVREVLSNTTNEMMGYVERGGMLYNTIIKFAGQAYATVFGTMPVLPFRNLFQNLAFHPDKSALVDPRNRALNAGDMDFYHTYVSQMEAIPRDLLLSEEGALPLLGKMNQLIYRLNIYGASDSKINRVWCYWASLNKAERALKAYKKDGNVGKFASASGLSGLTHTQQVDILKTLTIDETGAVREIALEITNNVHFLYDRAQRAAIEMGGMGRIFGSLVIFPRSVMQRVLKQFKVLDPASYASVTKKKRAMKILLSMLMGSMAANYLFGHATGRTDAPYNPLNILRWSPGGLALGSVTAITDVIGTLFQAMSGSEFALGELPKKMERASDTMIPYYKLMITTLEAAVNLKYIDRLAYRELRSIIEKKMQEMGYLDKAYEPNKKFYEAERNWEWKIKHAIFSTEPPPPDPLVKAVEDITKAQGQLGKFILAEDSDDGYTYEMTDLASDIRKATSDIKPEDITKENGFSDLTLMYKQAEWHWDTYYYPVPASQRLELRELDDDRIAVTEAYLFLWGKLSVLRNDRSLPVVQELMRKYDIPNKAVPVLEKVAELGKPEKTERIPADSGRVNPFR